ncbi:SPOR domain-containing protein [Novosphingobium sp. ZW T3_23]|uniref:SPOR domain-containing protein n=1 Tax=Novosphingobium sp. ZW T3_23 TaxID=3378084 RepID=UPI0038536CF1
MRLPANRSWLLAVSVLTMAASGPAGDYPIVVGEPFVIGTTTWTPTDKLNYDAVGYGAVGAGPGLSAAHKTLPLPSYVEVTALDSGRTILVRLERRGPMANDTLLELSPDAASQLGFAPGVRAPIRVRRVNPPEVERAALRSGGTVPERMETPEGLLKVLRRKLAEQAPLKQPPSTPPMMPKEPFANVRLSAPKPVPVAPVLSALPAPASATAVRAPSARMAETTKDPHIVQVGAFAVEENARRTAAKLKATTTLSGKFWRVSMGPFANRAQAAAALEKARAAGYSDARIQRAD